MNQIDDLMEELIKTVQDRAKLEEQHQERMHVADARIKAIINLLEESLRAR